jgi:hypothetical protein
MSERKINLNFGEYIIDPSTIITIISLIVFIGLLVYLWNKLSYSTQDVTLIPGLFYTMNSQNIPSNKLPKSVNGLTFTYSLWIYIDSWDENYGRAKHIFHRGDINLKSATPNVWLYPTENKMMIRFNTKSTSNIPNTTTYPSSTNNNPNMDQSILNDEFVCDLSYVPIQKWMNLLISLDGKSSDIYVDGKLLRSCVLNGIPEINTGDIWIGGSDTSNMPGFRGYISKFRYIANASNSKDALKIYNEGPLGSLSIIDKLKEYLGWKNKDNTYEPTINNNTITINKGNVLTTYNIQ